MGDLQSHALGPLKGFTKTSPSNKQDSALEAGCSIEKGNRKGKPKQLTPGLFVCC